jgi:hypothetical protein
LGAFLPLSDTMFPATKPSVTARSSASENSASVGTSSFLHAGGGGAACCALREKDGRCGAGRGGLAGFSAWTSSRSKEPQQPMERGEESLKLFSGEETGAEGREEERR